MVLITFSGCQASGKTTALKSLKKKLPQINFYDEVNPYTLFGNHQGGAYTTLEEQIMFCNKDIEIIKKIKAQGKPSCLETGIFHLVYLKSFNNHQVWQEYEKRYFNLYKKTNSKIIFINSETEICWQRRKNIYNNRVEKFIKENKIKNKSNVSKIYHQRMKEYKDRLFSLRQKFLDLYDKLPFKKYLIENSNNKKQDFIKEIYSTTLLALKESTR